jgi:hypothetical protein
MPGPAVRVVAVNRAPDICPHWPDGKHGRVLVKTAWWQRLLLRMPGIVAVCPRCDGWYPL